MESVPRGQELPDFDRLWNYGDPAATEERFRALLPDAGKPGNLPYYLELLTQIARTRGLQGEFDDAHELLDEVESKLTGETRVARVRYLLERGRAFHAAHRGDEARPLFERAWELARANDLDFHAVDAAHMLAIASPEPAQQQEWNLKAMEFAESSEDRRARGWLGVLYHNLGMTHLDAGAFEAALQCFEKDFDFRKQHGSKQTVLVAKWCVAHALRRLGRLDDALKLQQELRAAIEEAGGEPDGFVFEELGEIALAQGDEATARTWFKKALPLLEQIAWLREDAPDRLARLRQFGTEPFGTEPE